MALILAPDPIISRAIGKMETEGVAGRILQLTAQRALVKCGWSLNFSAGLPRPMDTTS
jgi:hypothetical protein